MTIQTIIAKAVKRLKAEGKLLTPDFYAEAFCMEAKKANMQIEDCQHLAKFNEMLNKDLQKDLKNYNIKTMHEFIRFLISKLNRTNPTQCSDTLESETLLTKRILQVITVLHNKEASELAQKTLDLLEHGAQPEQLDQFRQRWVNFLTTYDDTFLQKLKEYGNVDTKDLQKTIENLQLACVSPEDVQSVNLQKISKLLIASFVPSIASSVNDTIASLSEKIQQNPALLESVSVAHEIRSAISLRIALDKETVKEMVESIDGVLDKLSLRLIDMIERSDTSNTEIQKIKKELESYSEESTVNFKLAHKKLFTIAVALEENTQLLSKDLKGHSDEVQALSRKVHTLEKELEAVKQESKEDFLTKLYNKRALDEFMNMKEGEYKRYGRNFAIVMFDIDHFKKVNDTYGHEAGDAVLSAFAKILKKESRTVDIIGRFGGEEFLSLLSETDLQGGVIFAEKVRKHVEKTRFVYKGKRIKVTVSAGISQRSDHISLEAAVNSADEYLYKAKKEGRNKAEYKK
ncbi:GGDEF domain-containing protein [Sulfurimonas autotrophica]|uniref:diguanylate cyclase n=1 Tax=Sulfurimonas autotrophica (strain ATCC BAA-671 / DSM 16294 / JCM 11897 / OK10) TaxID=563040 RepID=E0UPP6_SULAO|nr:GGDEF domain-containing protein [Sulfurimonas autotrophica]ADN08638.1 diguanylate cyclase [Sulfurimonas autotrophica DSM 16294]